MEDVLMADPPLASRSPDLRRLRRWDPLAFIFLAHGIGLVLAGETAAPLAIALLTGALSLIRLGTTWLLPHGRERTFKYVAGYVSIALAYGVIGADGGTESPFFFWILLLLIWQGLLFSQTRFLWLGAFTVAGYLVVTLATSEFTAAAGFRLGLLAAFILTVTLGRSILDRREAEVARLDDAVKGIIDDAPMAMAILDADRDTVLYANGAAHGMGIVSREAMAHILLDDPSRPQRVTTLAELVVGSPFQPSPLRTYRHIGSPRPQYRIGFHPRRVGHSRPVVLVYGMEVEEGGS